MKFILFAALALAGWSSTATAQHQHEPMTAAGDGYGKVAMANPGNAAAQAPFERGVALLHDFEYVAAAEAFRQAQAADPTFALAYWGEAMTYNHPLWSEVDVDAARAALAKLGGDPAARREKVRDAREGLWLDAVEALYGSGSKAERDAAYSERMRLLFDANPNDIDARTFYALSIMGTAEDGRDIPTYMRAAALLEEAFPEHPDHPGLLHYLIHAYDDPAHAPLGQRAAGRYAVIAPAAGHAQHMISHIYLALGRWAEVEKANVTAMEVVNRLRASKGRPPAHCGHYDEWLVYAVLQQGGDASSLIAECRSDAAAELAKSIAAKTVIGPHRSDVSSWSDVAVRQVVDTGAAPDFLSLPPNGYALARFNLAYAEMLLGRHSSAKVAQALAVMKKQRALIRAALPKEAPDDHELGPWIDRAVAQGEAVAALAAGQRARGLKLLDAAAAAEAALPPPFGPPVLQKPSYELLGDELLALGRKADAAAAYRHALAAAPNRRLSVLGLKAATAP
ncbi:MAG: hypothetical protein ACM3ZV_12275 [Bacillota bacterium]